ncbi:MAG: ATP-binding cassette domain-containing protein [Alphaproteobacteria bacterium]|nr:ATP-binding cassette domain-containing protein [Alphaproteobacteria bacterium]
MTETHAANDAAAQSLKAPPRDVLEGRHDIRPLRRLIPFLARYPLRLALTLVFLLVAAVAQLAIPATFGSIIDEGFIAQNLGKVAEFGWMVMFLAGLMAVASGGRFYLISVIGELLVVDLRQAVFDHMMKLDVTFYDTNRIGDLTSRLNGDVGTIRGAISINLSQMIRAFVTVIGALVMMAMTNVLLTLAVVVLVPAIILPVFWFGNRLRDMSRKTQDVLGDISALATESLSAARTVKAFRQEANQKRLFAHFSKLSFEAEAVRLAARAVLVTMIIFLSAAAMIGLIWWGANLVFSGAVTAGELAQFLVYALLAAGALTNISEVWGAVQIVSGATERLFDILDIAPAITSPPQPVPMPEPPLATVEFDHVAFTYDTRETEIVLRDVSFSVSKGEMVALVGPSGSGKSTVFALLQRFYDIKGGSLKVDGIDVRKVDLGALRGRFAYVEQESMIFGGTIAENIRFGKRSASDEDVRAAARAALVEDFVAQLPDGYDTVVGERGTMLSGGQKQRVAIARALLKDAPILLLDEATSALDAQSEHLVQKALERLMEGRTSIVIAHRLATIRHATRILVLDAGRIIDHGTHEELIAKGGRYAELAKLQFRDGSEG